MLLFSHDIKSEEIVMSTENAITTLKIERGLSSDRRSWGELPLRDVAKIAIAELRPRLEKRTMRSYENMLCKRIFPALGHIPVRELNAEHLKAFCAKLSEPNRNFKTGGNLSPKTIKNHVALVSTLLTFATREGIIAVNSATSANLKPQKILAHEPEILSDEETLKFLKLLGHAPPKWQVLVKTILFLGLRRGEVVGLKWSDVDFETNTLTVRRSVGYTAQDGVFEKLSKTKSGFRVLKFSGEFRKILLTYRENSDRKDVMFPGRWGGGFMHPDSVGDWLAKFCARHNFRKINPHLLRHTNISMLISGNAVSVKYVSTAAGHSNIGITCDIYAHAVKTSEAKVPIDSLLPFRRTPPFLRL
jgi:integrase